MNSRSPFAGLNLINDAPVAVDQRLFASKAKQRPSSQTPSQEAGKEATQEASKLTSNVVSQEARRKLDLSEKPIRKNSFLFTTDEWEAMEDVLLELRRKYALDVTKNDLVRCAFHLLVEDFESDEAASLVVGKLRGR